VWTNQGLWLNVEEGLRQEAAAGIRTGSVKVLGQQPGSELPVLLNRGRFGLYMQLVSW
jgi:topoisomerase IA-like protein